MSRNYKSGRKSRGKNLWETLCKNVEEPGLSRLEIALADSGIASRRNVYHAPAPILEVQEADYEVARDILAAFHDPSYPPGQN